MAIRRPLVIVNGQIQQIQAGDTIDISGDNSLSVTNDNAGSIVIGAPVYVSANDHVDKAMANAAATKDVFGLVKDVSIATGVAGFVQYDDIVVDTTAQWDAVTGG